MFHTLYVLAIVCARIIMLYAHTMNAHSLKKSHADCKQAAVAILINRETQKNALARIRTPHAHARHTARTQRAAHYYFCYSLP